MRASANGCARKLNHTSWASIGARAKVNARPSVGWHLRVGSICVVRNWLAHVRMCAPAGPIKYYQVRFGRALRLALIHLLGQGGFRPFDSGAFAPAVPMYAWIQI